MLERLTEAHLARRRRPGKAVLLSIAAHVAAVAALVVAATWRIDKLDTADPPVLFAGIALPPPSGGDEPQPAKPKPPRTRRPTARDLVQPAAQTDKAAPDEDPGQGPGPAGDGPDLFSPCAPGQDCQPGILDGVKDPVCGDGQVEGNEECDDGGRAAGDGCSAACAREATVVQATLVEGHRMSGDPQIPPPPRVHAAMLEKGQKEVIGTVKMCLDRGGAVRSLRVLRSTGHPLYDDLLTSRMTGWRYRPYQLSDGTAVPVCTAVTFIYRIE